MIVVFLIKKYICLLFAKRSMWFFLFWFIINQIARVCGKAKVAIRSFVLIFRNEKSIYSRTKALQSLFSTLSIFIQIIKSILDVIISRTDILIFLDDLYFLFDIYERFCGLWPYCLFLNLKTWFVNIIRTRTSCC